VQGSSDGDSTYAATDEITSKSVGLRCRKKAAHRRGIEVGHIFNFGELYSRKMGLKVSSPDGRRLPAHGQLRVGVRAWLVAVIEASHDGAGIIWPEAVAPWRVGIVTMSRDDASTTMAADIVYEQLHPRALRHCTTNRDERGGSSSARWI